ncbi:MAG TPA: NAD(P)-binding oxidoreductase [Gemmatimonadales bacterium]|nr:NAD(P)-binding oxidoreductase [Gemmatimonadales bacterium]
MSQVLILGATGSLGRCVTLQAIAANHEVSVLVRTPSKLPTEVREAVRVHQADLATISAHELADLFQRHDAVINTAGLVSEGQVFADLVAHVVDGLVSVAEADRPVCWFLAGAALLDLDDRGRRGVDLPRVASVYWPHRANFDRIRRSTLDWRVLCPGPMVDQPPIGLARMRVSLDRVPVQVPSISRHLPGALLLPLFVRRVPEMIVSYADAAALMLANLTPAGEMSRHRVGLALPSGIRGKKQRWTARPRAA